MARICIIRQGSFPNDPRLRREVESLVAAGHEVDIICRRLLPSLPLYEHNDLVAVRRVPLRRVAGGPFGYLLQYVAFLLIALVLAGTLHLRRRYKLVQVNSMPDVLVFAALVPRLFGARVLLDLHECMPEFFATKFKIGLGHPAVRFIARCEQASIGFADFAITCSAQMREAFIDRGAPPAKVDVIVNGANDKVFDPGQYPPRGREPGRFVLISHGTMEERYGLDTIIRAVALVRDEIPGLRLDLYGGGAYRETLRQLASDLGLEREVYFSEGWVPMEELVQAIADADVGVVAMKRDAFRDLTLCNKMYDFIAMGKPIISSRTRSVEDYYGESCFELFTADDPQDLARAIRHLHADPAHRERLVGETARVNEPYRWPHQRERYLDIVAHLLAGERGIPAVSTAWQRRAPAHPAE
ncbi:MAG: glycosyltransferase family 4 protein [Actinomycetota bacterium]|nr:glycosyltransferase family 4 protein [Actinomycetota bacterium]